MKENKGITLIVLVITIILLLILAGISIVILTGKNGLFSIAKQAKDNTLDAQNLENITLADYENRMNQIIEGTREQITVDKGEYEQLKADVENLKKNAASNNSIEKVVLWEGNNTGTGAVEFSDSIDNYDMIQMISALNISGDMQQLNNLYIQKEDYTLGNSWIMDISTANTNRRLMVSLSDKTQMNITTNENMKLLKVYGINY